MTIKILLSAIYVVFLFLYIYGISFNNIKLGMGKIILVMLVGIVICFQHIKRSLVVFNRVNFWYYFSQIYLLGYAFFINMMSSCPNNESLVYPFILRLTEFIIGAFLIVYVGYNVLRFSSSEILLLISMAIFLQAIFVYLSFISVDFRMLTEMILPVTGNIAALRMDRVRGFSNAGGALLSIIQGIGAVISFYLAAFKYKGVFSFILFMVSVITGLSTILIGRSGLILYVSSVLMIFLLTIFSGYKINIKRISRIIVMISMSMFLLYEVYLYTVPSDIRGFFEERVAPWAFELFINASESGKVSSKSTTDLNGMLFLPETFKTFLMGDGIDVDKNNIKIGYSSMRSDSGYVVMIFAIGLIGAFLLYYLPLLLLSIKAIRHSTSFQYKVLLLVLIFNMFFSEIKEPFFLRPSTYPLFLIILYIPLIERVCIPKSFQKIGSEKNFINI